MAHAVPAQQVQEGDQCAVSGGDEVDDEAALSASLAALQTDGGAAGGGGGGGAGASAPPAPPAAPAASGAASDGSAASELALFAGVFAEHGGTSSALSADGAEVSKASRGGWAHGASGVLPSSLAAAGATPATGADGAEASSPPSSSAAASSASAAASAAAAGREEAAEEGAEEHELQIVGSQLRNLYVGCVPADFGVDGAAGIGEEDAWFIMCASGSLFGHGKNWDDAAGPIPTGSRLTLRLNSKAGTLRFLLNGKPHGPGHSTLAGPVKLCVSMGSGNSAVRLLR